MKRFTLHHGEHYLIPATELTEGPDHTLSGPAVDQLGHCEDFLELIRKERDAILSEMERLRARNQTKSVRFRELFISKLVYANIEAQLAHCGLSEFTQEP